MREDPGLDTGMIAACLEAQYGLRVASVRFLPLGYDLNAAVYEVAADGATYFLKVRFGSIDEASLLVPRADRQQGAEHPRAAAHAVVGPLVPS